MRSDIDRLMATRQLDALVIAGDHDFNPPRHYLTDGAHVTGGLVVKKRDEAPFMVVNAMEVEEAAKSGLHVYTYQDLGWVELMQKFEGDRYRAAVGLWANALARAGVESGRVGIYGSGDLSTILAVTHQLAADYPQYEFVGEQGLTLFDEAAITKDAAEIDRIRHVARRTSDVVRATWDYISSHKQADNGHVVDANGQPLTIGAVKRFIRLALIERELEDTGMIFAQGRDGGFPHSRGEDDDILMVGQAIVFDLFPRELGGGYHHDMTRTWCIGHAPAAVQQAYDHVIEAFNRAVAVFGVEKPTRLMDEAVNDVFEAYGHPTLRQNPATTTGYMHSLGHGVGLKIHEMPRISFMAQEDHFQIGNVFTIEPGLYYPEQGFGIRIEDTVYVAENGELVTLTDVPKDLVLPLKT